MVANTKLSGQFGKIGRPAFRPPSETRTPYIAPLRTKANGALCYSYACASPNLTTQSSPVLVVCLKFLGRAPAFVLISYQRMKRSEAINIFFKGLIVIRAKSS
jgi:hypothetical protein